MQGFQGVDRSQNEKKYGRMVFVVISNVTYSHLLTEIIYWSNAAIAILQRNW